jgi:alkylhydroperoxidase family enzyme
MSFARTLHGALGMPVRLRTPLSLSLALGLAGSALAADAPTVPATRAEMKQTLEGSKKSKPRLPLPPPSDEELEQARKAQAEGGAARSGLGGSGIVNNARMRRLYLPPELVEGRSSREPDPNLTLSPTFKTMFFWIVSRANNCTYCMGHQEVKLAADDVTDDRIAALDGDWSEFPEAERAAFAFTKKLTYEPHKVGEADLRALRPHYNDLQILEILFTVAGNNATNRWTGALAIPQEEHRVYLTPTSAGYRDKASLVAPLDPGRPVATPACARPAGRPALETRAEVEKALEACRARTPRLPLVDESTARAALPGGGPEGPLPQWIRLLANFPKAGAGRIASLRAAEEKGNLPPRLRAQIDWIAARNDRAWYALGHAQRRLRAQGLSDDEIFALDGPHDRFTPAEKATFAFVRKLTTDPALIGDDDVAGLRALYSDREVAEIVYRVTNSAFFDRLTEAAGLALEDEGRARP